MESELSQAYYGVYCSSKEILKNNQRHLYCSMLDLLTSTCKTTGLVGSKIVSDEMIEFWLSDILPLMFDTDRAIQTKAVEAFEQGLASMDVRTIHNSKQWTALKTAMSTQHAPKIHKLREERNRHWHRVWGYMIRILDKELLKGASTINSFLSIVELGFRSTDNTIRAESFLCWRLLIEIFSKYDELSSPKRLKLICIPLKSSQSKSAQAAEVKLRVWWYLLTCFGDKLGQYFDTVVEPFLVFCFGGSSTSTKSVVCAVQQYAVVRELAIPCLIKLISSERNEYLDRCLRDHKLEALNAPSPLLEMDVLEKHWQALVNACMEAIRLMGTESSQSEVGEQHLFQTLLIQILHMTFRKDIVQLTISICTSLTKMLTNNPRVVIIAMNNLAAEGLTLKKSAENVEMFPKLLEVFANLFISARSIVPPAILQRCVDQVFSLDVQETSRNKWRMLATMLEKIIVLKDDEDYEAFETKLIIWRKISQGLLSHLRENSLDVRVKDNASLMDKWILWPVQLCVGFAGRRSNNSFDQAFCSLWRQLLNAGQNSPDRRVFLSKVHKILKELLNARHEESAFGELFDAYVAAVLKLESDKDNKQHQEFFELMQDILKQQLPKKPFEACLNTLKNALVGLKNTEVKQHFDAIKPTIVAVVQLNAKGSTCPVDNKFLDEWKRNVMDKLRSHPNKEVSQQIKELLKGNNDVFVVIPSVWSMNPDKLTERQKEKMSEKADIPALYNDMSQSQDASSLKPWTPKKIVISQKDKSEIVLEGPEHEEVIVESEEPKVVVVEKVAEKVVSTPVSKKQLRNQTKTQTPTKKEMEEAKKNEPSESVRSTRNSKRRLSTNDEEPKEKISNADDSVIKRQTRRSGLRNKNENKKIEDIPEEKSKTTTATEKAQQQQTATEGLSIPTKTASKILPISEDVFEDQDTPCMITDKENILQHQETELNTMTDPQISTDIATPSLATASLELIAENKLPAADNNKVIVIDDENYEAASKKTNTTTASTATTPSVEILSTDLIDLNSKTNTISEIIQAKEVSPKKTIPKFTPLSSPPDRKLTNNSSSPTLRPKPSSHLTGRGAQLINMIRNKKVDISATYSPGPQSTPSQQRNPAAELMELTGTDHTSTPVQPKEFLVFSKRLPSPTASPSASILKRKLRHDSIEDLSFDSPAFKRKRVSFHDPPVSVTKEYLRDIDETKTKPKRCLIMDKVSEAKHALRRRSKLDSLIEIEKYNNPTDTNNDKNNVINPKAANANTSNSAPTSSTTSTSTCSTSAAANKTTDSVMDDSITSLKWNDSRNTTSDGCTTPQTSSAAAKITHTDETAAQVTAEVPPPSHVCQHPQPPVLDIETATKMVLEQCSLDTILEKYFATENTPQLKSSNIVAKFLSNAMETNAKIKTNVLETLSENHSKDFLDHAVQENLSSVVCDRLNLNSVIDYICAKSKINAGCRNNLLQQIPDILKHSKNETERFDFIQKLITHSSFTDEHILDLIALLMQFRCKTKGEQATMVSESAVDSSSNL
ncbi:telomere-associated protein RIF1 isoform X1 [Lucilia sericata]|uniref:telomere-associated protein RIF1 isoform X1 n=1 Tax=Lucilia sericata TaxID=13632 RepID=UPI0018A86CAC|nr:telomere-associated protein RIF1 isoform X1 [Lucilia sericata]